jgi:hypothetical protein
MGMWTMARTALVTLALLGGVAKADEPTSVLPVRPPVGTSQLPPMSGVPSPLVADAAPGTAVPPPVLAPRAPLSGDFEHVPPAGGCPCATADGGSLFDIDLMLGMLMGIRGQMAVYRNPSRAVVVEAFYGALLDKLDTSEGAGAGARYYFRRTDPEGCNSLLIGPGVGAYDHFRHGLWMVAPTIDVGWLRAIGNRGGWEIGLNAGLGVGVAGQTGDSHIGRVTPLFTFFTGFRF